MRPTTLMRARAYAVIAGLLAGAAAQSGATMQPVAPSSIALEARGHGWVLTDAEGMSLYTYARDVQPGQSSCIDECAAMWPPLVDTAANAPDEDWGIVDRQDGTQQWAFRGKPLYRYTIDESPGDTYGEGVRALWAIALIPLPTPPGINIEKTLQGYVAANDERKTLYTPQVDIDPKTLCVANSCGKDWRPVLAPWAARDLDRWRVITRVDGLRQWTYDTQPLFSYAGDVKPRESNGDGAIFSAKGGTWKAVVLEPRRPYPDWITVHDTDAGQMLANLEGKTVYTYDPSRIPSFYPKTDSCGLECVAPEWVPVLADADATTSGGNWAIFTRSDGSRQWAYKGKPVFTNTRDKTQGSFLGYRHGGSRSWNVIMHSEDALVGTLRPP